MFDCNIKFKTKIFSNVYKKSKELSLHLRFIKDTFSRKSDFSKSNNVMLGFLKPNVSLVRSLSQLTFLAFCRALWEQAQHSSIQAFLQVYTVTRNLNCITIHTGCYRRDLPHFKSPGGDTIGSKVNGFMLVISWFACVFFRIAKEFFLLTATNCRILKLPHTCWMFLCNFKKELRLTTTTIFWVLKV